LYLWTEFGVHTVNNLPAIASQSFGHLSILASFMAIILACPFALFPAKNKISVANTMKFATEKWYRFQSTQLTPINKWCG